MMKNQLRRRRTRLAFTIVELLVVIAIIALLAGLAIPNMQSATLKAQSVVCSIHLRGIGVAVLADATDHNSVFPEIDQAAAPVYPAGTVPGIVGVLGSYGITTNDIQCPVDLAKGTASSFALYGSSYEWNPVFDDGTDPVTVLPLGTVNITVDPSRIRLCTDFLGIHRGKVDALYGDGHVRAR